MNLSELVTGLDIGTSKTCVVIGEVHPGGRVDIIGEGVEPSKGIQRGVVIDIEAAADTIRKAVAKAQRVAGAQISSCFVGVTGEHISSMNSKGVVAITHPSRVIRQEDVDRALESARVVVLPPDREIIHAIPTRYSIDGMDGIQSPVGMNGQRLQVEAHIVHGTSTFLQNLNQSVNKAGLAVERFVLESYAAGNAVVSDPEKGLGVALVDIGAGTTEVAIYAGGSIVFSSVLSVAGNHVTQDIAVGLQCFLAEAERVKLLHGSAAGSDEDGKDGFFSITRIGQEAASKLPVKLLNEIVEPRIAEILQMVASAIEQAGGRSLIPGGVILTGGCSQMKGITQIAESVLGVPCRLGRTFGISGMADAVSAPSYSIAVGLAVYGSREVASSRQEAPAKGVSGVLARLKNALLGSEE
mgnify:CR=1 FL=1